MSDDYDAGYDVGYGDGRESGYEDGYEAASRSSMDELDEFKREVALLFARYLDGEGCGCCEDHDHDEVQRELGEALGMPRYDDDSGIDYYKVIKGAW